MDRIVLCQKLFLVSHDQLVGLTPNTMFGWSKLEYEMCRQAVNHTSYTPMQSIRRKLQLVAMPMICGTFIYSPVKHESLLLIG